jgi:hypothetical protein
VTPVRRIIPSLLALCLGVCASLLLACGGDKSHLIPADQAQSINEALDQAKQLIDNHQCDQAPQAAAQVQARVRALPTSVDKRLRERLRSGAQTLVDRAGPTCQAASTTTETIPTTTQDTTPTDTTPTQPTQTDTTPTDTTTTPPPTDTTTLPPTDTGTGGASPDGTGTVTP